MSASMTGFGNWQQALDEIIDSYESKEAKLFRAFQKLQNNEGRLEFIIKHHLMRAIEWLRTYFESCSSWHAKSQVEASFWKSKGNKFFQQRKYALAIDAYTQSCINAPPGEGEDLCLALGNRSAALFHMKHYSMCVKDIDRALSSSFPPGSLHKLLARKISALGKLGHTDKALKTLQKLKEFVGSSKFSLTDKKKDEFLKEMLTLEQGIQDLIEDSVNTKPYEDIASKPPEVLCGPNLVIPQASQCVTLSYTAQKGRHLCASQPIPRGSTVIVEKPFAAVLLPDHYDTHCHHCFLPLPLNCIGCERCTMVRFCNEECRESAWSEYHSTECPYLDLLHSVGIAHLSLRIVLCAGLPFLLDFLQNPSNYRRSEKLSCLGLNIKGQYDQGYLTVFDLMTHEESTDRSDMLQYSLTAGLLMITLVHSGFFSRPEGAGDSPQTDSQEIYHQVLGTSATSTKGADLPPDMLKVGGLLLRHILQLVCNAHAITSIQTESPGEDAETSVSGTEQTRIATAIYPTASLMNHSCDPTIVSSFIGKTLVVRTLKDVSEGSEVYNCYGPHYCRMDKEERQAILQSQYRFLCDCEPCTGGKLDQRRFSAYRCPRCSGVLTSGACLECGLVVDSNTLMRLKSKALEASKLFENALSLMEAQHYNAAVAIFHECQRKREEILYRDHRDLALVEDAIARCYASLGDFTQAADHLFTSVEFARLLYGPLSQEYGHELQKLAEVLFNADRLRECVDVCERCLSVLSDLYHPKHEALREMRELHATAQGALYPQMKSA